MKAEKYTDFFEEAEKSMSKDSIRRAEREANKIMLNFGLAELRKHAGHSQSEIPGYRQSSVSKIEARKERTCRYFRKRTGIFEEGGKRPSGFDSGADCSCLRGRFFGGGRT